MTIKKLLLWVIIATTLLTATACNNGGDKPQETMPPVVQTEAPTEAPHTEHTGKENCEICGINYFDTLANYIKTNADEVYTYNEGLAYKINNIDDDERKMYITYFENEQDDLKKILIMRDDGDDAYFDEYNTAITIIKPDLKFGEYDWTCFNNAGSLDGFFEANQVRRNGNFALEFASSFEYTSKFDKDDALSSAKTDISVMVSCLVKIIEKCDNNLTPSDFGFERFE